MLRLAFTTDRCSLLPQSRLLQLSAPFMPLNHKAQPCRHMAGHSKWHNIRQRKGAQDKRRSALFAKAAAEIEASSKACQGDDTNMVSLV